MLFIQETMVLSCRTNIVALVAISKGMRAVKLFTSRIVQLLTAGAG